jgi:D-amino-acid dehydrogenase
MMKQGGIAVIGAGVVGVATAYALASSGWQVKLIDARAVPGSGASFGNAAQLSWAYGDAMASPALLRHLPAIALGRDPSFRVAWRLDPGFLLWGLRFLLNTPQARWWRNTAEILALAEISRHEMERLRGELDLSFSFRQAGKMHLYPDAATFEAARATVARKRELGLVQHMIGRDEATAIEPALAAHAGEIAGVIYTPGDAVGDAGAFCRTMTEHLARTLGVETIFGHQVTGFGHRAGRLNAIRFADREDLEVARAVAAIGPAAPFLRRDMPEARSIQPVRGYSLTMPKPAGAPSVSLTDVKRKLAFATIGDRFRVAGLADIAPTGRGYDSARFETMRAAAAAAFPDLYPEGIFGERWSGERPTTPSSCPIIAPSRRIEGLYLAIGHGMLGWTLALGSARKVAEMVAR